MLQKCIHKREDNDTRIFIRPTTRHRQGLLICSEEPLAWVVTPTAPTTHLSATIGFEAQEGCTGSTKGFNCFLVVLNLSKEASISLLSHPTRVLLQICFSKYHDNNGSSEVVLHI